MKIRADIIAHALSKRHEKDFFTTQCKSGPTQIAERGELKIFDALAVKKSWTQPCVTIYEIKVSRSDFLADEKWPAYKQFCNRLYFACPRGLVAPDEISNGIGLITYNPGNGALHTAKKAVYQDNPLPTNVFFYILMNKIDSERHPFFSTTREKIEAFLEDKADRAGLANRFKSRLANQVRELAAALEKRDKELAAWKASHEFSQKLQEVLRQNGFNVNRWNLHRFEQDLKNSLGQGISPKQRFLIDSLSRISQDLKDAFDGEDANP